MELGSSIMPSNFSVASARQLKNIIGARKSMLGILSENGDGLRHFLINGRKDAKP